MQEVSVAARAVVVLLGHFSSFLGAYSEGRGGTGISAVLGSWLIVFAVQDVWGGVCAVPPYCAPKTSASVWTQLLVFGFESFLLVVAAGPFVSSDRSCLLHLCPAE